MDKARHLSSRVKGRVLFLKLQIGLRVVRYCSTSELAPSWKKKKKKKKEKKKSVESVRHKFRGPYSDKHCIHSSNGRAPLS